MIKVYMHILLILGIFLILLVLIMSLVNLKFNLFKHKKTETSDIDLKKLTHPRPKKFVKIKSTIYRPGMFNQQTILSDVSLHSNILFNINKLNKCLEKSYSILNYEKLIIQESKDGSKKYILDFFIHENNHNDTKRLLFEIIKDKDEDEFYLETIKYLNSDFEQTPMNIKSNDIYGINTNSIIDSVSDNPNKVIGISTSSLEKSIVVNDKIKVKQNKIPENISIFPSNKILNKWNTNGLHDFQKKNNSEGYNHACRDRLPTPNFNPTLATLPRSGKDKNEIFDMNRGIIRMPFANTRGHRVSTSSCCSL